MRSLQTIQGEIEDAKRVWNNRNTKFKEWYEILTLVDLLQSKGMESYVSNEPQTFYNMAHYLLTKGELSHIVPVESESAVELDKRARINRACEFMWSSIDRHKQLGGNPPYIDELGFYLLVLGWYSVVMRFNRNSGLLESQLWNPYDTYPVYANNMLESCVHSYKLPEKEVLIKARAMEWNYGPNSNVTGEVTLDDYFFVENDTLYNIILVSGKPVTGIIPRPEMSLLVAPVGGFPDRGSLITGRGDWRRLIGRSIFEANAPISTAFNKWKSMMSQILRDTAQPIMQENSATPQATPEQLRERGGLFHYAPGEQGLQRIPPAGIPLEIQAHLVEMRRELQKGSFSDAVYGMVEGQSGYTLSLLATSSASQILYPYMDAKHFVVSEHDRFWLSNLKTSKRVFDIKGKLIEKLKPTDIPEDVTIIVESDVATPKDWLERGTIANMLKDHVDQSTIITEILRLPDPQNIKRRRSLDRVLEHPMSLMVEMIAGYQTHADYLEKRGDTKQAELFRKASEALETQLGVPPAGSAKPTEEAEVSQARKAGAPAERPTIPSRVSPPETGTSSGFAPQELRNRIGRGTVR